jgi:F-type H+-transporting ATPase subunit b
MRKFALTASVLAAMGTPASAASGPFLSLGNTDFVVLVAFILFALVLIALKVPSTLGKMLDARAQGIQNELNEARQLRDEAQALLASYERKQKEVQEQADRIVETARADAAAAAEQAKADLKTSVARRLAAAEDKIAMAQSTAERQVRNAAVNIAIAAAGEVVAKQMTAADGNKLIDAAISEVEAKLH